MDISALGTSLGSVAGINGFNLASLFFGLVLQEGTQLCETPRVKCPFELFPSPFALANVCQILYGNHGSRFYGINYPPAENVVAISTETVDLPCQSSKMSFGRAGAFRLKTTLQPEVSIVNFLPSSFTEKLIPRSNGGSFESHVHSNHFTRRLKCNIGKGDNNMEPKLAFAVDAIGRIETNRLLPDAFSVGVKFEAHLLPTRYGGKTYDAVFDAVTSLVITDRNKVHLWATGLEAILFPSESGLYGFGCSHSGCNNQLRGEIGILLSEIVVCLLMQANAVLLLMFISYFRNCIEAFGVLPHRFKKDRHLFGCRIQLDTDRSLHIFTTFYAIPPPPKVGGFLA
jgi:hypothetical protein